MLLQGVSASATEPTHKEVVIAVLGASSGLGGFVLVFLGLTLNAFTSLPGDTSANIKNKRRTASWVVLAAFGACVLTIATAFAWLATQGGDCLYALVVALFAIELLVVAGVASNTAARTLR